MQWFADTFGFSAEETVALMGAHTLGKVHQPSTLFKYWWVRGEHSYLNNQFYKSMVAGRDYALQCPNKQFILIGIPHNC